MTSRLAWLALLISPVASAVSAHAADAQSVPARFDLSRPEIAEFIAGAAKRTELKRAEVRALLAKATPQPKIIELITKPAERVSPWWEYRARFLTERRIREGAEFWLRNRAALESIAEKRGVPPEYLVAIVGVETFYGRIMGSYRVLDALATLAFDYPQRGAYFRGELEQYLLLVREEKVDPLKTLGSYAGAMGAAQFMPSSYRRFAVDGGADGHRNLWMDWDDVFASVANYFREHGWETGAPVIVPAKLDPEPSFQLDPRSLELDRTIDGLNAEGVRVDAALSGSTPAMLVSAEEQAGPAYRVGFRNFQVITRYNRSARYAMAVHDLAQAIAERVRQTS